MQKITPSVMLSFSREDRIDKADALEAALTLIEHHLSKQGDELRKLNSDGVSENDPGYRLLNSNIGRLATQRAHIHELLHAIRLPLSG